MSGSKKVIMHQSTILQLQDLKNDFHCNPLAGLPAQRNDSEVSMYAFDVRSSPAHAAFLCSNLKMVMGSRPP